MILRFKVFIFLVLIHLNFNCFCQLASGMDQKLSHELLHSHKKAVIRKKLAQGLSEMFGDEVPEYKEFTNIVRSSNEGFLQNNPHALIDPEDRVLSEKHGAIRVGTAFEMKTVTRIFGVAGMAMAFG